MWSVRTRADIVDARGWVRQALPVQMSPTPPLLRRSLRPTDTDQLELFRPAGDVALADDAEPGRVELQRDVRLLEPAPLVAAHRVAERAGRDPDDRAGLHDPGLVLGVPAPELLAVRLGRPRARRHDRARDRAADAGLPRALTALDGAVRTEGHGVLAEVPDVAGVVGGVPVVGRLRHRAVCATQHVV